MKPIGELIGTVADGIERGEGPTRTGSSADAGGPDGPSDGTGREPRCPRCGGLGWYRKDVEVQHPDFGRAFPCDCKADELARRRQERVKEASQIASLDEMRFDSFRIQAPGNSATSMRSLEAAERAARAFAEEPEGWLVLHGDYGCGKTHLAAAIVNQRLADGASALFVVVPDLLDYLRASYGPDSDESFDARLEAVRSAPLLVLDDLGTQAPTAWAGEKLFQILNHRYNRRLPTVITTNHAPEELEERLRSRLGHFDVVKVVEIRALDYRGGLAPGRGELSSLGLHGDMSFQTWDGRVGELPKEEAENLERARALARDFATSPGGWLVWLGEHGAGKTHLAAAIANEMASRGGEPVFVVVPDLLDHLRATFSPSSRVGYDKRFEEIRSAPLLVLDDLGTESATPWAQEKLFQILNHRYAAMLPTVITTSLGLGDIHPRLRARMLDRRRCVVFEIVAPPYHGAGAGRRTGRRGGRTGRSGGGRGAG